MSARLRSTIKLVKPRSISTSTSSSSSSSSPTSSSPHSCWSFHLSTAFHGKPKDDHNKSNNSRTLLQGFSPNSPIALWRDAATLKAKAPWGAGHDWYMIEPFPAPDAAASQSTTSTSSTISTPFQGVAIAVADGVGGWEDSGVDPSHFSQALMYYCAQAVKNSSEHDPVEIMKRGYQGVTQEPGVVAGSSTACVITLNSANGLMKAANLGDSTFLLIRDNSVIHNQPSQTHYFNAPRQLSKLPKGSESGGNFVDLPRDADVVELQLKHDDILLVATDGFSDNVWPHELEQLIKLILVEAKSLSLSPDQTIEKIAGSCCQYARLCSFKPDKKSPFEAEGARHRLNYKGGKVDDVCVVAVLVQQQDQQQESSLRQSKL